MLELSLTEGGQDDKITVDVTATDEGGSGLEKLYVYYSDSNSNPSLTDIVQGAQKVFDRGDGSWSAVGGWNASNATAEWRTDDLATTEWFFSAVAYDKDSNVSAIESASLYLNVELTLPPDIITGTSGYPIIGTSSPGYYVVTVSNIEFGTSSSNANVYLLLYNSNESIPLTDIDVYNAFLAGACNVCSNVE